MGIQFYHDYQKRNDDIQIVYNRDWELSREISALFTYSAENALGRWIVDAGTKRGPMTLSTIKLAHPRRTR